ncbi:thioredoxin family protein [Brassicibacter mesophilus]|uniref:thioredoxin family protein n=1 Tax=Brassicibacter mesophilus TaxID=745119 RepID=UPI003D24669F
MNIKILGTGCSKCDDLEKNVKQAVDELGIEATIEKVEDIVSIMKYGVMTTPVLVVDEKVVVKGRTADVNEIKKLISK